MSAGGKSAPQRRTLERLAAWHSPWRWVLVVVGVSFAVRAGVGLARPGPWILPDELLYTELARSVAEGSPPAVRGRTALGWGVVYPLLAAPAWALFDDPLTAYRGALVVNALVMSLAAIPAYLLASLVVGRRAALLVAGGSVLVPAMVLTGTVMTENAAYPLFLMALWLVARAVRSASGRAQLAALAVIGLLALTRIQGVVVLPVLVLAIALYALTLAPGARRAYLARFWPTALVVTAAGVLGAIAAVVSREETDDAVGRSGTLAAVALDEVPRQLSLHVGALLVMVAVVPAVASVVMIVVGLSRTATEPQRLFASVALAAIAGVLATATFVGTAIDTEGAAGINERYLFYLVPVLLLGLAAWIEARPLRLRFAVSVLAVAVALVALLPYDRLEADATFYAPALVPLAAMPLEGSVLAALTAVSTLVVGMWWIRSGERSVRALAVVTASWLAVVAGVAVAGHQHHANTAARLAGGDPSWLDDAVPAGGKVAALWDQRSATQGAPDPDYFPLMVTGVLSRTLGSVLRLGGPTYYENVLPTVPVRRDGDGIVDADGEPVRAHYLLVPCTLRVAGPEVARSPDGRMALHRVGGTVRLVGSRPCRGHDGA